jgi:hypothetical protein
MTKWSDLNSTNFISCNILNKIENRLEKLGLIENELTILNENIK